MRRQQEEMMRRQQQQEGFKGAFPDAVIGWMRGRTGWEAAAAPDHQGTQSPWACLSVSERASRHAHGADGDGR